MATATPSMDEVRALAFDFSMAEEGRDTYTDDPRDPGGPTKYGIALNYNRAIIPDKDGNGVIDARDVQLLTEADARRIYAGKYWQPNRCDAMPAPLAFMYADMVFNPGPGAAANLLQRSLVALGASIAVDGRVGPATLAAVGQVWLRDPAGLLTELTARRQQYYGTRGGFATYGLGWARRADRCLTASLRLLWGIA